MDLKNGLHQEWNCNPIMAVIQRLILSMQRCCMAVGGVNLYSHNLGLQRQERGGGGVVNKFYFPIKPYAVGTQKYCFGEELYMLYNSILMFIILFQIILTIPMNELI